MSIVRISGISLHYQVRERIRADIRQLENGTQIDTEEQLVQKYGVSRGTVRKALNDLVQEGLLYRVQGVGTFTKGPTIQRSSFFFKSYTEQLVASGKRPGIKNIQVSTVEANSQIAEQLLIEPRTQVWKLARIRLADDSPIALATAYLRKDIIPTLKASDLEQSLLAMLRDVFGIVISKEVSYCTASLADSIIAGRLGIDEGSAIFLNTHVVFHEDLPVCVDITESIGSKYALRLE